MKYQKPEMEIVTLKCVEIVTASVGDENTPVEGVEGGSF